MISNLMKKFGDRYKSKKSREIKVDIKIPITKIGANAIDSGFVCLDRIPSKDAVIYVAGIGEEINFELDLLNQFGNNVQIYAFDPTPKSKDFINGQELPMNFHFYPYAVVEKDCDIEFAIPKTEGWISGSCEDVLQDERQLDFNNKITVEGRCISSLMEQFGHKKIHLLKLDIEGSEFEAINNVFDNKLDIDQITVDYHDYMFKDGQRRLEKLLDSIKKSDYKVFYVEKKLNKNQNLGLIKTKID